MCASTLWTRNLFAGVNRPTDPINLTDLEKMHLPTIDAPSQVGLGQCFDVTIEIGRMLPHPKARNHFIEFIDLYADDQFLARANLTAVNSCPVVRMRISLSVPTGQLRAYGRCNMHGVWTSDQPIAVSE